MWQTTLGQRIIHHLYTVYLWVFVSRLKAALHSLQ
jgi:hypothetical protein